MIHQAGKPDTDAHVLVVIALLCIMGLVFVKFDKPYLTMNSPVRVEVASGEVLDMHLGELLDYTVEREKERRKEDCWCEVSKGESLGACE